MLYRNQTNVMRTSKMWCRMNIRCQKETSFMSEVISRTEDNRGTCSEAGAWGLAGKHQREQGRGRAGQDRRTREEAAFKRQRRRAR